MILTVFGRQNDVLLGKVLARGRGRNVLGTLLVVLTIIVLLEVTTCTRKRFHPDQGQDNGQDGSSPQKPPKGPRTRGWKPHWPHHNNNSHQHSSSSPPPPPPPPQSKKRKHIQQDENQGNNDNGDNP